MTTQDQQIEIGTCSLRGDRQNNQDRCIQVVAGKAVLLAVADGMGGHPLGDVAAQIFVDICEHHLRRRPKPIRDPRHFLTAILEAAHQEIQLFGDQQNPPVQPRTTVVVVLIEGAAAYWAHAGDSRLYLFRDNDLLTRTTDHSYVERLRQQGIITQQQLERHPQRNFVTRCLGGSGPLPDISYDQHPLNPGDALLLCTDGLWSSVDQGLMGDVLFSNQAIEEAAIALAEEAAQSAYPDSDNVTVVACRLPSLPERAEGGSPGQGPKSGPDDLDTAIAELKSVIDRYSAAQKPDQG